MILSYLTVLQFKCHDVVGFASLDNLLGATSGQNSLAFAEGNPGLLSTGGSTKCLETLAQWTARSVIVLHCLVLDLLAEAFRICGYSYCLFKDLLICVFNNTIADVSRIDIWQVLTLLTCLSAFCFSCSI